MGDPNSRPRLPFKAGLLLVLSLTINVVLLYELFALRASLRRGLDPVTRAYLRDEMAGVQREWAEDARAARDQSRAAYERVRNRAGRVLDAATESDENAPADYGAPVNYAPPPPAPVHQVPAQPQPQPQPQPARQPQPAAPPRNDGLDFLEGVPDTYEGPIYFPPAGQ